MKQLHTRGIIMSRTDFGEADRIITMLTPDHGKLRLMARGVRRMKSKLAGGIELFSVSEISFMYGKGEIGTLISTRLITYYSQIVQDIERVQLGYELIKLLNRATEDQPESEYFEQLEELFISLNDPSISINLIRVWFRAQLLRLAGNRPNLRTTIDGTQLKPGQSYTFDFDLVAFVAQPEGLFATDDIKFLRLIFSGNTPSVLAKVQGSDAHVDRAQPLVQTMLQTYIRL